MVDFLLSAPGLFLASLIFLPVALRSRLPWTPVGGVLFGLLGGLSVTVALIDPARRERLLDADHLPLLLLILLSAALLWRDMARRQNPAEERVAEPRGVDSRGVDIFSGRELWTGAGAVFLVILAAFWLPPELGGLVERFERVTPGLIRRTARDWLNPENRTVITLDAAGGGS